jgi:hypothetical protein
VRPKRLQRIPPEFALSWALQPRLSSTAPSALPISCRFSPSVCVNLCPSVVTLRMQLLQSAVKGAAADAELLGGFGPVAAGFFQGAQDQAHLLVMQIHLILL